MSKIRKQVMNINQTSQIEANRNRNPKNHKNTVKMYKNINKQNK